jgi:hypothetical protein
VFSAPSGCPLNYRFRTISLFDALVLTLQLAKRILPPKLKNTEIHQFFSFPEEPEKNGC